MKWDEARKAQLGKLWADPSLSTNQIAVEMGTSRGALYVKAAALGLKRPGPPRGRPRKLAARDGTGQRRFTGSATPRGSRVNLDPWHPALRDGSTIFPSSVTPAALADRLLISGEWNRKIGKVITKGRWKNKPIFTLTREERATCPRTCLEWATCYGNNLHYSKRISDDGYLHTLLHAELVKLLAAFPQGIVVRLHILGDFDSVEYVEFWREMLVVFPELCIFGFTARQPEDPIGLAILHLMRDFDDRIIIRISGHPSPWLSAEVVEHGNDATGIFCPAERGPDRCCATCALCWQSDLKIAFGRH